MKYTAEKNISIRRNRLNVLTFQRGVGLALFKELLIKTEGKISNIAGRFL
jgi:hypothetical protein